MFFAGVLLFTVFFLCPFVQDLPFPSPLESALTMGSLCAYPEGLPVTAADLREVGKSVTLWAQIHAQTSADLKGVRRLTQKYGRMVECETRISDT